MTYDELVRNKVMFQGKKYKYHSFVPDGKHQGAAKGTSGSVEWLRKMAKKKGISIRTVKKPTGHDIYYR